MASPLAAHAGVVVLPNAHGAHRPQTLLAQEHALAVQLNVPYESVLYYRGNRMGEQGVPLSLDVHQSLGADFSLAGNYKFISFGDGTDSKAHLWTGLFYHQGALSIGPSFKWHRNNTPSAQRDAYDVGLQAAYCVGKLRLGIGLMHELESEGNYLEFGAALPFAVNDSLTITPAAELSYTDGWVKPAQDWNAINLRVTAAWKVSPQLTVSPFIGANLALKATEALGDEFVGGVALQWKF